MRRLLWYGDAPCAATGFGTVSRNVLAALHATGDWEIVNRGINFHGQLHPFPYTILPAKINEPDPFGRMNYMRDLTAGGGKPFDLTIINNDLYTLGGLSDDLTHLADKGMQTRSILYYPVDYSIVPGWESAINAVTMPVAYSHFGENETKKVTDRPVAVIPHGCEQVERISAAERAEWRRQIGVKPDEFLWITVNRNSQRKDIARTIQAFAAFHSYQPASRLYVHCQPVDTVFDMHEAVRAAGVGDCVAFPADFSISNGGMPRDMLMRMIQLGDAFITTHLGEGWGLTVTEAMACGLPIVAPNNTTMPEILGASYPYLYPCADTVWIDNSGFRPRGLLRDIFGAMKRCYDQRGTEEQAAALAKNADFVRTVSWDAVGKMWLALIDHTMTLPVQRARAISEAV